jgi:beta-lactamase regulating signal transducer with metallopeptidase domain
MPDWTGILSWMATYWLHSTLLLGGTWLWMRWRCPESDALRAAAWKLAAAGAFLTASLQLGLSIESPVNAAFRMAWQRPVSQPTLPPTLPLLPGSGNLASSEASPVLRSLPALAADKSQRPVNQKSPASAMHGKSLTRLADFRDEIPARSSATFIPDAVSANVSLAHETFTSDWGNTQLEANAIPPAQVQELETQTRPSETARPSLADQQSTVTQSPESAWMTTVQRVGLVFGNLAGIVCLAWTMLGLLKLCLNHARFASHMRTCDVVRSGPARALLDQLLATAKIRRSVELLFGDAEMEPGAWGLFQWRIVLPPRAVEELPAAELKALLAHELAHLVRGDQWWIWTGQLLTVCFGWQPFNRIAFREWRTAVEYLCDAWAVEQKTSRFALARCLASVAGWRLSSLAPLAGVRGTSRSSLSGRVERLIDDSSLSDPWLTGSRRQLLAATGSFVAVLTICCAPAAAMFASPASPAMNGIAEIRLVPEQYQPDRPTTHIAAATLVKLPPPDEAGENVCPALARSGQRVPENRQCPPACCEFATILWTETSQIQFIHIILQQASIRLPSLAKFEPRSDDELGVTCRFAQLTRIQIRVQRFHVSAASFVRDRELDLSLLEL